MEEKQARPRSRAWVGVGVVLAASVAALVWLDVSGVQVTRDQPPSARPASVLPPSDALPIALWNETAEPVADLQGDIRLGYEKLPKLKRDAVTVRVRLEMIGPHKESQPVLRLNFRRPLPGRSGQLALGALLAAVNEQQAVSRQLSGEGRLVITVGDRTPKGFQPLSNNVAIQCTFRE